jgi:hypothetical protein
VDAITTNLKWDGSAFPIRPANVKEDVLVEDGDAAQGAARPFRIVFLELGIDGLQEGSNERLLEGRTHNTSLVQKVHNYKRQAMSEFTRHFL